ncbi:MAG: family 65 glycosyl hydrolase [Firmicutes bacterium HGW-Firmicutes-3]|jgi:hypothetical glycosyl hydrolase|nr:MAG: family 65 glycosyl hydrolase [Firmicutes bacterium HGW-Firmicutes-3]
MKYDKGKGLYENWIVAEDDFDPAFLGKSEVTAAQGNGYMGMRSTTEETYVGEVRNTFIAGTFNKFEENEVTELPNCADLIQMDIELNGYKLDLTKGKIEGYTKALNLRTGELTREVTWHLPTGERFFLMFRRFISLNDKNLMAQSVEIKPLDATATAKIASGINGQVTNSGVQHFLEGDKRLYDGRVLQMVQTTTQSKIHLVLSTVHNFYMDELHFDASALIRMERRKIMLDFNVEIPKDKTLRIEKISNIYCSRELENEGVDLEVLKKRSSKHIKSVSEKGYEKLYQESAVSWDEKIWQKYDIIIDCPQGFDQLALRFAIYHLTIMTPAHDKRMSIGAKGLTGEGYKGHTFWDTEIFILPFFIYTDPQIARSLLEYRYLSLPGAHKKAKENGFKGAMFPWESAWLEDGEVTPEWGAADIVTGMPTKIWSGFIEQHITSDVSYAVWHYYQMTNDEDYMEKYGYELFMDTALFWSSRLEWSEEEKVYYINDVVGPDEYKEHVNNNAFVNYMAHWTLKNAMVYYELIKIKKPEVFNRLNNKLELNQAYKQWVVQIDKIYLPCPDSNLIVPQDDTYLTKESIDLSKYKNQEQVGSIFKDYNLERVNELQVSKQADVLLLLYLLEDLFDDHVKKANWAYYEPRTLHDSSLSLATHCIFASKLNEIEWAYELFLKTAQIDLGPDKMSSNHGIHAASLGGLWQCVVNGFGGIRVADGILKIEPNLPRSWKKISFPMYFKGDRLLITIDRISVRVDKLTQMNRSIDIKIYHETISLVDTVAVSYN